MTEHMVSAGVDTVFFDLEGTLVRGSSWPALFAAHDAAKERENLISRYVSGELSSYMDWSEEACKILRAKGMTKRSFYKVMGNASLTGGAEYLCKSLKVRGYRTGIITGGFEAMAQRIKSEFGMDFYAAACCDLRFDGNGFFLGWSLNKCDYEGKVEQLRSLGKLHDIRPDRCAYVGDGEGDIDIMKAVAFPIAFNPRIEAVRNAARVVEDVDLKKLLKYFPPIKSC